MYLIYVDESGDVGHSPGSSPFFILSGMVLHELVWHDTLEAIITFRRQLRSDYGLKLREEIHCKAMIHRPDSLKRIPKSLRLQILRDVLDFIEKLPDISIIHVCTSKQNKAAQYDVFDHSWRALLQRFHNTISYKNFPGPQNPQDYGLVIADRTDEPKLRKLARQLRRYNPVPSRIGTGPRQIPLRTIVEDAVHRDSLHSYFLQLVDVCAFFLYQRETRGCRYIRKKGGTNYFNRLDAALCRRASTSDPKGVVRL